MKALLELAMAANAAVFFFGAYSMLELRWAAFKSRESFLPQLWRRFADSLWCGESLLSLQEVGQGGEPP